MNLNTQALETEAITCYFPEPRGFLTGAGDGGVTFEALPCLVIGFACGLFFEDMAII